MIKSWLFEFARRHSWRFSLLFEAFLGAFAVVLSLSGIVARRSKKSRRRGRWTRWFYDVRTRFVLRSVERLMLRLRQREVGESWKRRVTTVFCLAGGHFMMSGSQRLGAECYKAALELMPFASKPTVHDERVLGATYFMLGDLESAHHAFERAGRARRWILASGTASSKVIHLGPGWFVAIGHSAMLDFYFKKRLLGWTDPGVEVLLTEDPNSVPGMPFVLEYRKYGLRVVHHLGIHKAYDRYKRSDESAWDCLSDDERFATIDDFWEYEFSNGEILTYTHAAARIQGQWEKERRAPLLALDDEKKEVLYRILGEIGVPAGGWYVCLHVRESGFHRAWNARYPTTRDANIEDYIPAIKKIAEHGGYVIRVGDPSMKRLPKMDGLFDYARSNLKGKLLDVLLPAGCRFFIGTNSGYATVPGIYGVPKVLTNWVPIALPLWFGQDLMIPKLYYNRKDGRLVDFMTMFSTRLGAIQNLHDIPEHIEIRPNTPEEINEVVLEMLDRVENCVFYTPEDNALQEGYYSLAEKYGSYRGSRIGRDFLREYASLVWSGEPSPDSPPERNEHETPPDRRTAIPVARRA